MSAGKGLQQPPPLTLTPHPPPRVSHSEQGMGGAPLPHPMIIFEKKPMGCSPPLKNKVIPTEKQTPSFPPTTPLKSETPFHEMIPRKKAKESETAFNTYVSFIKQHWKKIARIPHKTEHNFLTWSIQNFVRKVKQFVRKYITWLIGLINMWLS